MKSSIKRIIIFFFIFIYAENANCQKAGNLYLFVSPANSIMRIDTALFNSKNKIIYMTPGKYPVRMWAYGRKLVNDTLIVNENSVTIYRRKLPLTDKYKTYRADNIKYKTAKGLMRYGAIPVTVILALNSYSSYKSQSDRADGFLEQANVVNSGFSALITIDKINEAREKFEYYSSNYDKEVDDANKQMKKTKLIIGSGILLTGALNYCVKFLHKPTHTEIPLLSDVSIGFNEFNDVCLSLHLNISGK